MNKLSHVPSSAPSDIQATVMKIKDLLKQELSFVNLAQNNKLEAMKVAFDIGEIIENEVLGSYGSGKMEGFAKLCGFSAKKTAYNYLNLYRAAGFKDLLTEHADLPRTYWYTIGSSIKWSSDMMGDMLRRSLLQYPIWKKSESEEQSDSEIVDMEKLGEVCKALNDLRKDFKQGGILYAYQAYELHLGKSPKGMDEMNKWFANKKATTIYTPRAEDTYMEGFSFINERMPIPENKWQDICYLINFNREDDQRITDSLERIVEFDIAVSQITGWTHFSMDIGEKTKAIQEKHKFDPTAKDVSYRGVKWKMEKMNRLDDIRQQAPDIETVELKDKLIFGSCLEVLKTKAFLKRSIDCCLTDPPYGEEVYCEWREHTKVYHDEPKTTKEAAELLGQLARTLVNRELIKDQFVWFSFVPIDEVHLFLPPVLDAFKGLAIKHQVLVWDKVVTGKAGGYRSFARQAEAILYVNVGDRTLAPITLNDEDEQTNLYSSIFRYRAERKDGQNEFWKPPALLEHLIKLATGEDDNEAANRQLILDPFCGAGSTGVAAINCKRDFRLIECYEGQFKKAKDNILEAAGKKAVS